MKHWALALLLFPAGALGYEPPARTVDPESLIGSSLPSIKMVDDAGRVRTLRDYSGQPLLLLPMYTQCESSCLRNTQELKAAIESSRTDPREYRVLLFSFDAGDSPQRLREFREKQKLPLAWAVATASADEIHRLMEAIGFQYANANGQFMHPNGFVAASSNLKIAKFVFGSRFHSYQVDDAIQVARGKTDFFATIVKYFFGILIFTTAILGVYLTSLLMQRKAGARSGNALPPLTTPTSTR